MLDLQHMRALAHLEIARRLAARNIRIGGRPLGAPLAALETEAGLLAGEAVVIVGGVDRHAAGVHFLVAERLGAGLEHLEVVVAGQAGPVSRAGDAELGFRLFVPGLHLGQVDRPVEQIGALDIAVGCFRLEFMRLKAQRGAGPVCGGPAHRLDDPCGQAGKIPGNAPVAGGCTLVEPGELAETFPFVVDVVFGQVASTCLQRHHADALLRKLVGENAAAGARSDDDDHAVVGQLERCCHDRFLPQIQLMSLKPRSM
jgi:hypothetical protein